MKINKYTNFQKNKEVRFGQIKPEHLFISLPMYEKNQTWAEKSIKIIENAKDKIKQKEPFESVMNFISEEYKSFGKLFNNYSFGALRTEGLPIETMVSEKNSYAPYLHKLSTLPKKQGISRKINVNFVNFKALNFTFNYKKTPFTKISLINEDLSSYYRQYYGNNLLIIQHPYGAAKIKKGLAEVKPLYNKIITNNQQNINEITQDAAKIHWLLSQTAPFYRGSAGIADIFCKSLFESKNIQVSPYKHNIDPNLEAFMQNIDEYTNNYQNFFQTTLKPF